MSRLLLFILLTFITTASMQAQCTLTSEGENPYQVIVHDISYYGIILSQLGTTCNARVILNYDIEITNGGPEWWNGSLHTLHGVLDCFGSDGSSYFGLPNAGGLGTTTSAYFSFKDTRCSNVALDCLIEIEVGGPDLSFKGQCGALQPIVVPVDFKSINVSQSGEAGVLVWSTLSEINSDRYDVQRSTNGHDWKLIGSVPSNNDPNGSEYKFELPQTVGTSYYRVSSIDFDGSVGYSNIVQSRSTDDKSRLVYPNPASDQIFLTDFEVGETITVFDMMGRPALIRTIDGTGIDVSMLVAGMYRYTINRGPDVVASGALVKQ